MEKKETLELIRLIMVYYPNFKFGNDQKEQMDTVTAWHGILRDYDVMEISKNLIDYVKTGTSYPPVVGQLLGVREKRAIPNVRETRYMITQMEQLEKENQKLLQDPEEKRRIQELQAEGRRNLGMPVRTEGQG